ncbi:hypothetical protein DEU38_13442 [Rhodococcus sp. AG1013]|nr:hypothetical protein DEU38_13442 [Rhodococcus sp. AG1013]
MRDHLYISADGSAIAVRDGAQIDAAGMSPIEIASALSHLGKLPKSRLIEWGPDGQLRCRICGYIQERP